MPGMAARLGNYLNKGPVKAGFLLSKELRRHQPRQVTIKSVGCS
ncbi:hypothetical protein JOH51_003370 [Rhizobium leguminosarum]|nr:hypothetical protein [Rhizobium leguminosarum]